VVEVDDDLPPRMQTSSPAMSSTTITNSERETLTTSRPSTPPNDKPLSSHLPIHAGFDLNAIKDVLQEVEQDPSKSQAPPPPSAKKFSSRLASPPTAVPFKRPQSTPPNNQPIEDTAPRSIARFTSREDPTTSSFSRSISENIYNGKDEQGDETYAIMDRKTISSFNNFEDDLSYISRTPRPRPDSSLTLPDGVAPPWGVSSTSPSVNTAPSSTDHSLYNGRLPSPPVMPNPFASSSSGLGFGSLDGSVNGGVGFHADPWSMPSSVKKTTLDSYASNSPWS